MRIVLLTTDNREHYRDYRCATPHFGTAPEALLQGLAALPDIEVHVVSCCRAPMTSPEKLAPNTFFHSLYVPRVGWMGTAYQGCIRAVRRKLRQIQPDIVHGQGTERDCAISAVFSGFPNLLTIHGNVRLLAQVNGAPLFSYLWISAQLEGITIPRAGGVICITRYTQQAVSDLAARTWILPNAVDQSFFEVEATPPPGQPPRILVVGLVCVRKNQNAFIQALDDLAKQRQFQVIFLGIANPEQPYAAEFLRLVQERPWCTHAGFADRDQLKSHLREATALALPSLEDNCPMVVLEAMASGVPVIAAKVGGVPELIAEGETGTFCDPLNAASMRAAVERVLADVPGSQALAKRARAAAWERFHPRSIGQQHLKIYREVLSKEV